MSSVPILKTEIPRKAISAEWSEIDFTTNIWTIPADKAKNGCAHRVPISKLTLELLAEIKKINRDSRWLFPSERTNAPILRNNIVELKTAI